MRWSRGAAARPCDPKDRALGRSENTNRPMKRANAAFDASGLTLDELGQRMGAAETTARMSAWLKFCAAVEVPIEEVLSEKKKSRSK
jgi:hypothetical protein